MYVNNAVKNTVVIDAHVTVRTVKATVLFKMLLLLSKFFYFDLFSNVSLLSIAV